MPMKRFLRYFFYIFVFFFTSFLALDYLYPLDEKKLYRLQSKEVRASGGELLWMSLSKDGFWRMDLKKDEVPSLLKKSVLLYEDRYFYYHFGINPISVFKAMINNATNKRKIGASTITMQVARMMQRRERNYANKLIEMFNALQLEWHYSKDEILAFYLNLAPYGGNIEGVKMASYFYFNKEPKDLTIAQIALLSIIPKNPNLNRPDKGHNLKAKRHKMLSNLYVHKIISKSQSLRANIEPMPSKRFKAPFLAPQFSLIALKNNQSKTHIHLPTQLFIKKTLQNALDVLKSSHVDNAAAVLIDNEKMDVISYVGSENFYSPLGQNDGVRAVRSPGSTLKPFIYALAIDKGLITPKQELFDIRLHAGFYEPKNFNRSFLGIVRADEALQYSLNIPAVELNMNLEKNSLYELLKKAQIKTLDKNKDYYGQAVALGGFGISLLDLAHLYTAFANKGVLKPLKCGGEVLDANVSLISPQSAYLVSQILIDGIRPEFSAFWESEKDGFKIAFKTGTSADSKDLYTMAFSKKYTLGVWMGNFSGEKTDSLTGNSTANKAVFKIFSYLNAKQSLKWLKKPNGISEKNICIDAIKLKKCKNEIKDYTVDGVKIKRPCELLRGEVLAYLLDEKKIASIKDLSSHECYEKWKNKKPVFAYPYERAEVFMEKGRKLMLKCYGFKDDEKVYLRVDGGSFMEAKSGEELFVDIDKGFHQISCMDSFSNAVTNKIHIRRGL